MDDVAMLIRQNLELNVVWLFQIFFDVNPAISKGTGGFPLGLGLEFIEQQSPCLPM